MNELIMLLVLSLGICPTTQLSSWRMEPSTVYIDSKSC